MYSRETPGERKERSWVRVWSVERLSIIETVKPTSVDETILARHSLINEEEFEVGIRTVSCIVRSF
jgi:hypothetical protein